MKFIFQIFLLLGLIKIAHGHGISAPTGYLADRSVDGKCSSIKSPKRVFGMEICIHDSDLRDVAIRSGLFEIEGGRWVLSAPGVPIFPTIKKDNAATLMYGVAMCAIENGSGFHGAGGKCFYGIASIENRSLTFRSRSIPSNEWNAKDLYMHRKLMHAFYKTNLKEN